MSHLKALIFDVDGTLADTEQDGHRPAFNAAFRDMGLDWHWDVSLYGELLQVAGGKERIRYYLETFAPDRPPSPDLDRFIARLHARKTEHWVARLERGDIPLRPGVSRLMASARRAGVVLAIATTTSMTNVTALLRANLGAASLDWFPVMGAGDGVPVKKPAPDVYLYVLKHLGLPAHCCVAIEDSAQGLQAAQGAGITTLITPTDYTATDDFSGAAAVLEHLGEPGRPGRVIQGTGPENGIVDIGDLEALLRAAHPSRS
ncbi:haloacid dehalogenase superfamily, subfamily IA, variant 3 with third motif having DD or ED [Ectothiorhodospira magna]|uniref:Haloacid dehalogenase superfamily, subfamily IA, variant 3 with third motif having DD or ED n=1 Tax=Ectothiorhodospira magna TaxID=867345 RepID=A0A1H9EED7_9GAMM|nr:HAD family hydrolase [Ectothiorhodospira magna]SEQ24005.1 haloacid dehalogenase superfamily, subfamily IA, variant 3 with third motif having DD or ED [Ectothiorhodospira magna]